MEFFHRFIPNILERQKEVFSQFQSEKALAKRELEKQIESDQKGGFFSDLETPEQRRANFERDWEKKELGLYKEQLDLLRHRMEKIDQELFPDPDKEQSRQDFMNRMNAVKDKDKGFTR